MKEMVRQIIISNNNRKQTALRDWPISQSAIGLSHQVSIDTPALDQDKSNHNIPCDFGLLVQLLGRSQKTYYRFSNGL